MSHECCWPSICTGYSTRSILRQRYGDTVDPDSVVDSYFVLDFNITIVSCLSTISYLRLSRGLSVPGIKFRRAEMDDPIPFTRCIDNSRFVEESGQNMLPWLSLPLRSISRSPHDCHRHPANRKRNGAGRRSSLKKNLVIKRAVTAGVLVAWLTKMTQHTRVVAAGSSNDGLLNLLQQNNSIRHNGNNNIQNKTTATDDIDYYPCTIERLTETTFWTRFPHGLPPLYPRPIVIVQDDNDDDDDDDDDDHRPNRVFRQMTTPEQLVDFFGTDFNVTLTSSNALSEHVRVVPLVQYLHEIRQELQVPVHRPSNETWYLFGNTHSAQWKTLLQHYHTPPYCAVCNTSSVVDKNDDDHFRPFSSLLAHSFGIGHRGSGVQWHVHGPGVAETLHGHKHWLLYPYVRSCVLDDDDDDSG
jgi:hypothetical protein